MGKESVDVMIQGGKATAAPPLGPALGPLGVNIGQVVAKINEKTKDFAGMQVPVKVTVDSDTKEFEITIGTPPASALIKKEAGVTKGAGNALKEKVADLKIEQIMKVANMKEDALLGKSIKERSKEIVGTCQSMGILVEGVPALEAIKRIAAGEFDAKFSSGKTELSAEELKELEDEKKHLAEEMEAKRGEYTSEAKTLMSQLKNKSANVIRSKMHDAGIPQPIIDELCPAEEKK